MRESGENNIYLTYIMCKVLCPCYFIYSLKHVGIVGIPVGHLRKVKVIQLKDTPNLVTR